MEGYWIWTGGWTWSGYGVRGTPHLECFVVDSVTYADQVGVCEEGLAAIGEAPACAGASCP